jgi:hypothetical protein
MDRCRGLWSLGLMVVGAVVLLGGVVDVGLRAVWVVVGPGPGCPERIEARRPLSVEVRSARRGKGKAVVAVAREIAVAAYHMLTRREEYRYTREELVMRRYKRMERRGRAVPSVEGRAETLCRT